MVDILFKFDTEHVLGTNAKVSIIKIYPKLIYELEIDQKIKNEIFPQTEGNKRGSNFKFEGFTFQIFYVRKFSDIFQQWNQLDELNFHVLLP